MNNSIPEKLLKFGKSKKGNFEIIDTIANPHPYCLTPKHVAMAHDNFNGRLGPDAIKAAENKQIYCYTCKEINRKQQLPILSYDEHKHGLLVACYKDMMISQYLKEAKAFLLKIKAEVEKDGYDGFVFLKKF